MHLKGFRELSDEITVERLKEIWSQIHDLLSRVNSCWAGYSSEEIIGFSYQDKPRLEAALTVLRNDISELFKSMGLPVDVKICAAEYTKDSIPSELFPALASQVRSLSADAFVMAASVKPYDKTSINGPATADQELLLDGLAEDIEEKTSNC